MDTRGEVPRNGFVTMITKIELGSRLLQTWSYAKTAGLFYIEIPLHPFQAAVHLLWQDSVSHDRLS